MAMPEQDELTRLMEIAAALAISEEYFLALAGADEGKQAPPEDAAIEIAENFTAVADPHARRMLLRLSRSLVGQKASFRGGLSSSQRHPNRRPTKFPTIGETGMLDDVTDIAERALCNPMGVTADEMQTLAGAVVAHVRRLRILNKMLEK